MEQELPTLNKIFSSIADIRQNKLASKVKIYMNDIPNIVVELENKIEHEENLCLARGTETDAFDNHCRQISLLLKARDKIKFLLK